MKIQLDLDTFDNNLEYNDWLNEQYTNQSDTLNILGFQPQPSFVLFSLSQDTYQAAFADFLQQREDEIKAIVFESFPSPIAYYFYRFNKGYENELQRLHFLRDTWEAIVDILHAMTIAECRFHKLLLKSPILFKNLLTDSVAQRLLNIDQIIEHTNNSGCSLEVSKIVTKEILGTMRELNKSRNGFSHSAGQSDIQARQSVSECQEDMLHILDELRGLAGVKVMRYLSHVNASTLRCEVFQGHSSTKTIDTFSLTVNQSRDSHYYFQPQEMITYFNDRFLSLRPMVYYREDNAGHLTKLCMFRKTHGEGLNRLFNYEVVGESNRIDVNRTVFTAEINEMRTLLGLGPD